MRNTTAGIAVGAAVLLTLGACSSTEPTPDNDSGAADLTIWADEIRGEVLQPFAEQFGEANGIHVTVETHADKLQEDFIAASQQGEGPDILVAAHDWIGNLVQNSTIDPIQLSDEQIAALNPTAVEAVTYDGQVYGTPYALENLALFRNTELAPDKPTSVEELTSTGQRLVTEGKADDILSIEVSDVGNPYNVYPFYASGGGYLFGTDAEGNYDPTDLGLARPEAVDAFTRLAELGEAGVLKTSMSADNAIPMFVDGKTPYLVSGPWAISQVREAGIDYEVSEIPGFSDGGPATPFIGVQAFFVAAKGDNKTFATEFVTNFANTAELATALYAADPRPPALTGVFDTVAADNPDIANFMAAGEGGYILPSIPAMAAVWDPFGKAEAAVLGGEDPATAVEGAATAIQEAIGG